MSPASRATGIALVTGVAVKASAYVITPLVLATLAVAFAVTVLIAWVCTAGRG